MTPRFIGSEIYRGSSYGDWHPLRIPRVSTVIDLGRALGWLGADRYMTSPRAKPAALAAWHDPVYLDVLQRAEATGSVTPELRARHNLGTPANPVYPEVFRRPATAAGGSILGAHLLRRGGIVHNPGGGTHHGMPDRANGFCYLNDPALAILAFRADGLRRIAYVDIDAHHPDGVAHGFADDPDVLIVSVHEERRWPFTGALEDRGAGNVWNLPVPRGLNDTEMAAVRDRLILPRVQTFAPEAVILQSGADLLLEDPLSRGALSNNAHLDVLRGLMPLSPRLLVLGGGGYNPWSVARLWTAVWGVIAGEALPDRLTGPARDVLEALTWRGALRGRTPAPALTRTLIDAPRPGPLRAEIGDRLNRLRARAVTWA